jgi:hypothetical protein
MKSASPKRWNTAQFDAGKPAACRAEGLPHAGRRRTEALPKVSCLGVTRDTSRGQISIFYGQLKIEV